MHQLLRLLGVGAVVYGTIGQASAYSFSSTISSSSSSSSSSSTIFSFSPFTLASGQEEFIFSYSSDKGFTLKGLSLAGTTNVLNDNSTPLYQFTTGNGQYLGAGTGTLSEIISAPAGNYSISYTLDTAGGNLNVNGSVSPVPLPASSLLFMMALAGFGLVGFLSTRQTKLVSA